MKPHETIGKLFELARALGLEANRLEAAGQHHTEEYRCSVAAAVELAALGFKLEREFGVLGDWPTKEGRPSCDLHS